MRHPQAPEADLLLAAQTMPLRKTNDAAFGMPAKAKQTAAMLQIMSRPVQGGEIKIDFGKAAESKPALPAPLLQLQDQTESQESAATAKSGMAAPLQVESLNDSQESAASSGGSSVEKVLGELKQKLDLRKEGNVVEKKEKKRPSPKKNKGKENKDVAPKGKAKAKSKAKKEGVKNQKAETETTEAKNDESLPPWWNCKKKNHELFPEDTAKRFSSRCYHVTLKKELKRGIDKDAAKLVAAAAHRDALHRWKAFYPEA